MIVLDVLKLDGVLERSIGWTAGTPKRPRFDICFCQLFQHHQQLLCWSGPEVGGLDGKHSAIGSDLQLHLDSSTNARQTRKRRVIWRLQMLHINDRRVRLLRMGLPRQKGIDRKS